MNIKNLKRTIEMLKTIPQESFNMKYFRKNKKENNTHICGSVGCIVGHATMLDTKENVEKHRHLEGMSNNEFYIDFADWSYDFYDLKKEKNHYGIWGYMFADEWAYHAKTKTIEHAIYRIQRIIDEYIPTGDASHEYKKELKILRQK